MTRPNVRKKPFKNKVTFKQPEVVQFEPSKFPEDQLLSELGLIPPHPGENDYSGTYRQVQRKQKERDEPKLSSEALIH